MLPESQAETPVKLCNADLRLIACPHLALDHGKIDRQVPSGETIAGHLRSIGWQPDRIHARVFIDGRLIDRAEWETVVPQAGQALVARVIPMGGDDGAKTALRIVGMIAVVVASVFTAGAAGAALGGILGVSTATASSLIVGVMSLAGNLALAALIPPSQPKMRELSGQANSSPTLSLTGSNNQFAPYAPIPRVYGRHRIYPPLASRAFTEIVGNDQYLRAVFCLGYGPLVLSDFKIGETDLSLYQDVEMEVRYGYPDEEPFALFPNDVYEDALSIALTRADGWQYRTSQANAQELSWDVTFPSGLVQYDSTGQAIQRRVQIEVEVRAVGDTAWTTVNDTPTVRASATTALSGANNDLTFTATSGGAWGNAVVVNYVANGVQASEVVDVYADHVTDTDGNYIGLGTIIYVYLRYDGVAYSTAAQVKAALEASAADYIDVSYPSGNDGTGEVALMGPVYLTGGRNRVFSFNVQDRRTTQVRASLRWIAPAAGQYETRVRRFTDDTTSASISDKSYWTMLRTIQTTAPIVKDGLAGVALRIRATGQLNGTLDTFNCVAESILPDWDGTQWVTRPTSNPASVYRDVLQGSANKRPKADSRLDLTTIQDFHENCEANGFAFNAVIDYRTTVKQLRQDVLAAGRGAFGLRDMKYSVIQDLLQATPAHVLTPRNSANFRWSKRFLDPIHAFKVRFVDEDNDWNQGERIVYADGYDATNATTFEETDAGLGVTNGDQVYKLKRRELAEAYLRADEYTVEVDFEQLLFTRGDRVQFQHDVILAGLLSARIAAVTTDMSGDATAITLDDVLVMEDGASYGVRIARADGTQSTHELVTVAGESAGLTFATAIPAASIPAVGDLCLVGELGEESLDCIVKAIVPTTDYAATVTLLDYAPAIQTADSGTIPAYDPHITIPAVRQGPPQPLLLMVQSDESVLVRQSDGSLLTRIVATLQVPTGWREPMEAVQAQFRLSESDGGWTQIVAPVSGVLIEAAMSPVEDGQTYDLRFRAVSRYGEHSDWVAVDGHTVVGKTTAPPDVVSFLRDGDRLVWAYPDPPLDFAGFRLRRHYGTRTSWSDAQALHEGLIATTRYDLPGDLNTITYLLKAVDAAGNESENPATVVLDLGDLIVENLLYTDDKKASSFPGTHNGVISGGNLTANTAGTFWSGNDAALLWTGTDGDTFWTSQYLALEYITSVLPDSDKVPCTLLLDLTVAAQFYSIDYRVSGSSLFWSGVDATAFWSGTDTDLFWTAGGEDWLPWLGRLEEATRQVYEWRLTTGAGPVQGVISKYQVKVDVPDIVERMDDVTISALGTTRLTLTKSYRAIVNVRLTVQADGGTAITARVKDKGTGGPPLTGGPNIECLDAAGAVVAGLIDAEVQGY